MDNKGRAFLSLLSTATVGGFGGTALLALAIVESLSRSNDDIPGVIMLPFMVPVFGIGCAVLTLIVGFPLGWGLRRLRLLNLLTVPVCGALIGLLIGLFIVVLSVRGQMANEGDTVVKLMAATGALSALATYATWTFTGRRKPAPTP
ncbi:MAG: hypothetical protein QM667_11630 [Asticcacaulis sp.]